MKYVTIPVSDETVEWIRGLGCQSGMCQFTKDRTGMRTTGPCHCAREVRGPEASRVQRLILSVWTELSGNDAGERS